MMRRRVKAWIARHGPILFVGGVFLSNLLLFGILYPILVIDWSQTPKLLGVLNMVVMFVLNFFVMDILISEVVGENMAPRILPGLKMEDGLPAHLKTIVYNPILLRKESELSFINRCLVPSLESNTDPRLIWVVVSGSSPEMQTLERERILELRQRYGHDRILYFHRDPAMANWERKRGGYMQFMVWLQQACRADGVLAKDLRFPTMPAGRIFDEIIGNPATLARAEVLLMSDSDTLWPRDGMRKLVGKIAHPANRAYTIFQTDIAPFNGDETVLTAAYSFFSVFTRRGKGFWLIFRHLTFFGHGAGWRIDLFLDAVTGRLREGFLSHDIIEGCFARTAFVTDITTGEEWPANVYLLEKQQYRWWLGTWMARVFFGKTAPDERGNRVVNPLRWTDKYLLARIFSTYTNPPLIVIFIITAATCKYRALPAHIYLTVLLYFWFGRNILLNQGWRRFVTSVKNLAVVAILTPVLNLMTSLYVVKSLAAAGWHRLMRLPERFEWVVQSSLDKPSPEESVRGMIHLVIAGVFLGLAGTATTFLTGSFFAVIYFIPLSLTPITLLFTALPAERAQRMPEATEALPIPQVSVPEF